MAKAKKKAAKKKAAKKKPVKKQGRPAKKAAKKVAKKKGAKKASGPGTNKLGVKNSLVNNINARKKKGISRPKKGSKISKKNYGNMENDWTDR